MDYVYRAYDRVINKARGLLTFDGLLFAAFGLLSKSLQPGEQQSIWTFIAAVLPLVASLPLLVLFWMSWDAANTYETNEADFDSMVGAVCHRTWLLSASMYITVVEMGIQAIWHG